MIEVVLGALICEYDLSIYSISRFGKEAKGPLTLSRVRQQTLLRFSIRKSVQEKVALVTRPGFEFVPAFEQT